MANARLATSLWETWLSGPRKVVCSFSEIVCCWDWWEGWEEWDEWDEWDGCWDMARLLWAIGEGQSWGHGEDAVHVPRLSREAQHLSGQADSPAFPAPSRASVSPTASIWHPHPAILMESSPRSLDS